ncbi:MAG: Y-family DNA polymerase [Candidatus Omnitrophota bacterium]|nr:Y-family DNA polymerase [Candidatus Omnitrophota bacterium]
MDSYALVDCNNFYASCERVFDPTAQGIPVIVLSNNDGCVVARSQEAKDVGIQMGQPLFECQNIVDKHHVRVFSSNYVLYGDMSARIMNILSGFSPNIEMYSIDEAFLFFSGFKNYDLEAYGQLIRNTVKQHTGVPVSVGIAKTKTLAKIANHLAKKVYKTGVFCLFDDEDEHLKNFPVDEIWGIGRQRTKWLNSQNIQTAYDLKMAPDRLIKNKMTVTGLRTVWELRGIPCLKLDEVVADKKMIGCSRMFGYDVEKLEELEEAVSAYICRTCVKLRKQHSLAGYIHVYVETNRFKGDYYINSLGMYINPPSAYTPLLSHYGKIILGHIFKSGYKFKRAGVILTNLVSERAGQEYFIGPVYSGTRHQKLMETVDRYNSSANHGKIQFASEGMGKPWLMKQSRKSKRFTTDWNELLEVKI